MIPKSGNRFPACAKLGNRLYFRLMLRRAKAGRKRSCSNKKLERDDDSTKSHPALAGAIPKMSGKNSPFLARLDAVAAETETLLDRLLASAPAAGELSRPARLIEAMRYASLGGGKRFRPFLLGASAGPFQVPAPHGFVGRRALACVHCYSLVHAEFPAM